MGGCGMEWPVQHRRGTTSALGAEHSPGEGGGLFQTHGGMKMHRTIPELPGVSPQLEGECQKSNSRR